MKMTRMTPIRDINPICAIRVIKNGIEPLFPYFPLMHQHFHQCPFGTVRVRNP